MDISTPLFGGFTSPLPSFRSRAGARPGRHALAALFLLLGGCTQPAPPPSVLVIVVDTLRADHVGCLNPAHAPELPAEDRKFAGRGSPTPSIDRWAAGAARFEGATTPAPFTMPAMAALWTGAYPDRTGVVAHEPGMTLATWPGPTLAEAASRAGLATAAVVANPWLSRRGTRFDRGFDEFRRVNGPDRLGNRRRAGAVTDHAIALLDRLADRRFLLWVHYFDPHMPYEPPPAFARAAGADPGPGRVVPAFRSRNRRLDRIYRGEGFDEADVEQARRLYEGEVRYTDAEVGRLLDRLQSLGRLEETIVVLASDHGESLGEHGLYFAHDHTLYEELTRVALVVSGPGLEGSGRRDRVSLIDVAPTLCRMAGLPCDWGFDGRDLFSENPGPRTLFAAATPLRKSGPNLYDGQLAGLDGRSRMALRGDAKLIRTPASPQPFLEFYDLSRDAAETDNLARADESSRGELVRALANDLEAWEKKMKSSMPPAAAPPGRRRSQRESEALRSLGYLQ